MISSWVSLFVFSLWLSPSRPVDLVRAWEPLPASQVAIPFRCDPLASVSSGTLLVKVAAACPLVAANRTLDHIGIEVTRNGSVFMVARTAAIDKFERNQRVFSHDTQPFPARRDSFFVGHHLLNPHETRVTLCGESAVSEPPANYSRQHALEPACIAFIPSIESECLFVEIPLQVERCDGDISAQVFARPRNKNARR